MAIDTVPPLIAAQLSYLVSHCPFSVKVEQMWSGSKNHTSMDRFTLIVPYCLDVVRWDVIYNAMYPLAGPDVIFRPEDEEFQSYLVTTAAIRNSLVTWNSRDPTKLMSLIVELREAYVAYQKKRIGEVDDVRLKFEISTIIMREGIEMYMSKDSEKPEEVKFAVPLRDLDLNKLVAGYTWRYPQKIHLQVIFPIGKKAQPPRLKLISTSELKALFSIDDFRLPPWLDGMCMAEYLPSLEEMLVSQIKDALSSIETRKRFITALAPLFGRPIEVDSIFCRRATFLASTASFAFLVHFSLPLHFPKQKPTMVLQSSQHLNPQGVPLKSPVLADFPWSPRWDPSEMADRIFDFIADEALNFKKFCSNNQL
ncbi:hypothetical protein M569_11818, partial [Genlisea aurea]